MTQICRLTHSRQEEEPTTFFRNTMNKLYSIGTKGDGSKKSFFFNHFYHGCVGSDLPLVAVLAPLDTPPLPHRAPPPATGGYLSSIDLSIIYRSMYLSIYLSIYVSIYLSTYILYIYLSIYPIYISTHLSIYLSIYFRIVSSHGGPPKPGYTRKSATLPNSGVNGVFSPG